MGVEVNLTFVTYIETNLVSSAFTPNLGIVHECNACNRSGGSSVSIVSGYGLDDRAIMVRSQAEAKDFSSSLCV
jgi:hypothetical protein